MFQVSSAVEQCPVKALAVGSNPTPGGFKDILAMKGSRLTLDIRKQIEVLLVAGCRKVDISTSLNISQTTLRTEILRCHPDSYSAEKAHENYLERILNYSRGVRRILSSEEEQGINQMVQQGLSVSSIRTKLRCSYRVVQDYIKENFPQYVGGRVSQAESRLRNIENQIEIVLDLIKEILSAKNK